jgi:hypothetical protein
VNRIGLAPSRSPKIFLGKSLERTLCDKESAVLALHKGRRWLGGSIMATFEKLCLLTAFTGFFALVGATLTLLVAG